VVRAVYQPVGGVGRTVMPPTYPVAAGERDPNAKYLSGERLVDGEPRAVVVVDQEPSQANRVEEALRDARDAGRLQLPSRINFVPYPSQMYQEILSLIFSPKPSGGDGGDLGLDWQRSIAGLPVGVVPSAA
jgi:hypothetical protein